MIGEYQIERFRRFCWDSWVNGVLANYCIPIRIRKFLLNILGTEIKGSLHGNFYLASSAFSLGVNSYINRRGVIDNGAAKIEIGKSVAIGFNVSFYTTNHDYSNPGKRGGEIQGSGIIVEDGVWIGANSVVLSGVVIHSGCVIAAGSVVCCECEKNCLYAGVPAKLKKRL